MGNTHSGEQSTNPPADPGSDQDRFAKEDVLDLSADLTVEATFVGQAEFEGADTAMVADVDLDQLIHDNQIGDTDVTAPGLTVVKPGGQVSSSDLYILGIEHIRRKDWAAAAESLHASAEQDPSRNAYHTGRCLACLAYARYKLGQAEDAVRLYREAAGIDSNVPGVRSGLAAALMLAGHYDDAVDALKGAIRNDPARVPLQFNLGNLLARLDRLDEAEAAYRAGLECDAAHIPLLTNLGAVCAEQRKYTDAIAALMIACEQAEPSWRARFNLGLVLARLHRWSDSAELLRGLTADYPLCARTRILTARVMRCGGQYLEAIEVLDEFVDWGEWRSTAHELMGLIHESLGNPVQAVVFWKEALQDDPQFSRPLGHIALQALREGEIAEAATAIDKAIAIRDDSAKFWMIRGQIDLARDAADSAIESLERAIEIDDSYHDARYWLGRAHLEAGSLLGAVRQHERLDAAGSPLAPRLKRRIG